MRLLLLQVLHQYHQYLALMHRDTAPTNGNTAPGGAPPALDQDERALVVRGLLHMMTWSVRCGFNSLRERVMRCLMELPLVSLAAAEAHDSEGNSVLHVLAFAGQIDRIQQLLVKLPRMQAAMLLSRINARGKLAHELELSSVQPPQQPAVSATLQLLQQMHASYCLGQAAALPIDITMRGTAARARGPVGAVAAPAFVGRDGDNSSLGAARDLLSLAGARSNAEPNRARQGLHARPRSANKPYSRPSRNSSRRDSNTGSESSKSGECWLPGGLWWQEKNTPMPSGRQPGELAGWTSLVDEQTQQRMQEQKEVLDMKGQHVQGLESVDQAVAYLDGLSHAEPRGSASTLNSAG